MWFYVFTGIAAALYFLRPQKGARKPRAYVPEPQSCFSKYKKGDHFVCDPDGCMSIKLSNEGIASQAPTTVMAMFKRAIDECGDKLAMHYETGANYENSVTWTWNEYYNDVQRFARSLVKIGLQKYEAVNIIGFNAPAWSISHIGAIAAGGKGVGIYTTNGPDACKYITEHSEAPVVVFEGVAQLNKYESIHKSLPNLKALVVYREEQQKVDAAKSKFSVPVYSWDEFISLGDDDQKLQDEVDARIASAKPGECCSLIYTSGTTGPPKAVMISNDNATWTAKVLLSVMDDELKSGNVTEGTIVSYLPLSHIAAQLEDIFCPLAICAEYGLTASVYFARPDALKGSLGTTLKQANPILFFGVPRVWEKMQEKLLSVGAQTKGLKRKIATWAKGLASQAFKNSQVGGSGDLPGGFSAANVLLSQIHKALGFTKCKYFITGAAPITMETLNYFGSLDVPIMNVYGMSECTGPTTICRPDYHKPGSCGPALPGCELKIDHDPSRDKPNEGEVCFRGRHIMMGYMKDPEKSRGAIDKDGWLHSGDVGKIDKDGLLFITGRIKELIITAGGENIAPVPIEDTIKFELPAISNVMLIGDQRKFNSCLITLRCEGDPQSGFTNKLTGAALNVSADSKTVEQAQKDPVWQKYIQDGLDRYNAQAVSRAQRVQKFAILPTDFTVSGGELTATLKLKRPIVNKKYADTIDAFYK